MNLSLIFGVVLLGFVGITGVSAQRNDPTKNTSRKEKAEKDSLTYDTAVRRYGSPDQEKTMKDGGMVCTWIQTLGIQGDVRSGVSGGNTMKMVIFFDKNGTMTDRKFLNCPVFFPDSAFRLDR